MEQLVEGRQCRREFGAGEEALTDARGELEEGGAPGGVEFADDVVNEHRDHCIAFGTADEAQGGEAECQRGESAFALGGEPLHGEVSEEAGEVGVMWTDGGSAAFAVALVAFLKSVVEFLLDFRKGAVVFLHEESRETG